MFMGIDALSSVAYADGKVFVGSDTYSIYSINATTGSKISSYETGDQVISSPAIWENKIYVGSNDWNIYCFSNGPTVSTSITAGSNKLQVVTNEFLAISGQLTPGIPNAQITVALTTPEDLRRRPGRPRAGRPHRLSRLCQRFEGTLSEVTPNETPRATSRRRG